MKYNFLIVIFILILSMGINNSGEQPIEVKVTNNHSIILLIGDGMGWNQILVGALVEYGSVGQTIFPKLSHVNITTEDVNGIITDSAAAGTAIATGVKTFEGRIAMDKDGNNLTTILEDFESKGYLTGLVTNVWMQDATPATFSSHNENRDNFAEIAAEMSSAGIEILLGGGAAKFLFGLEIPGMIDDGYTFVDNEIDLLSTNKLPLLGIFEDGELPYEATRTSDEDDPTLSTMTSKALELMENQNQPFFLMVEGGKIDKAGHSFNYLEMIHEMIEFEKTIRIVYDYITSHPNDLMIVTADHETGDLIDITPPNTFIGEKAQPGDTTEVKASKRTARIEEIGHDLQLDGHSNQKVILGTYGCRSNLVEGSKHLVDTYTMMYEFLLENEVESVNCLDSSPLTSSSQSTSTVTTTTTPLITTSESDIPVASSSSTDNAFVSLFFVIPFAIVIFRRRLSQ
ncbi:MAG: alkaline phosphatase [Candidatus Heimdallarchaeota archaeon]|nr:alkaline phosphatase [Candidatus Heimdallarchaeota archaeon]